MQVHSGVVSVAGRTTQEVDCIYDSVAYKLQLACMYESVQVAASFAVTNFRTS